VHLNWSLDDSYTPTKLLIRAGTGLHDLQDIKTVCMDQPSGWIQFDVGMEPAGEEEIALMFVSCLDFQWLNHMWRCFT
jgi:anaphase-promoting complex subunit 10